LPYEFQFFQAVRLLCLMQPEREAPGGFVPPGREAIRFSANWSMPFPASQIQRLDWPQQVGPPALIVNFMGLTGPSGVLPLHYTTLIVDRMRAKDRAIAEFLDLFNHRMLSFFYRAWEKYRFGVVHERGEAEELSRRMMDLVGMGTEGLSGRLKVVDEALIFYSGLLSLKPRSAVGLRHLLEDYFEVPVTVEQFVGAWYAIDRPTQSRFLNGTSASEQLGFGAVVGDEVWNQEAGIRVRIGPLPLRQYLDFLPTGSAWKPLGDLVRFYTRDGLDVQIQLVLQREEVPPCELGEASPGPRLGWTTWVRNQPKPLDADDTILQLLRT
jgi:type VI secretion system protein ImpH